MQQMVPNKMEEDHHGMGVSVTTRRRWKPTREQISILEVMYRQGLTTPTTEQILEIARRLREYGSVEGKNVFYWFQNHKARQRQRQRQRQEGFPNLSRRLHEAAGCGPFPSHPSSVHHLPPPPTCAFANVAYDPAAAISAACNPCYFTRGVTGTAAYYSRVPDAPVPTGVIACGSTATVDIRDETWEGKGLEGCSCPRPDQTQGEVVSLDPTANAHQTLRLFPLHPTGDSDERCTD